MDIQIEMRCILLKCVTLSRCFHLWFAPFYFVRRPVFVFVSCQKWGSKSHSGGRCGFLPTFFFTHRSHSPFFVGRSCIVEFAKAAPRGTGKIGGRAKEGARFPGRVRRATGICQGMMIVAPLLHKLQLLTIQPQSCVNCVGVCWW